MSTLLKRITQEPGKLGGKPCIRGMRISVSQVLAMLGEGLTSEAILDDFPDLEVEDIQACLLYASQLTESPRSTRKTA